MCNRIQITGCIDRGVSVVYGFRQTVIYGKSTFCHPRFHGRAHGGCSQVCLDTTWNTTKPSKDPLLWNRVKKKCPSGFDFKRSHSVAQNFNNGSINLMWRTNRFLFKELEKTFFGLMNPWMCHEPLNELKLSFKLM